MWGQLSKYPYQHLKKTPNNANQYLRLRLQHVGVANVWRSKVKWDEEVMVL